jgi:hypothetical protein
MKKMNELTRLWLPEEQQAVAEALKKLFVLQGIPKADKTIDEMSMVFCTELMSKGFPPESVLAGIRKLGDDDLRTIKLSHVINASKEFIHHEEQARVSCDWCNGCGVVMMRNPDKYQFSLACKCPNGDAFAKQGNARWRGEQFQQGKHGLYEFEGFDMCQKASISAD